MGKSITPEKYAEVKNEIKNPLTSKELKDVAKNVRLSLTSVKRIHKSKSYTDFKRILEGDRGPQYKARVRTSKTKSTQSATKKKGIFHLFLVHIGIRQ